MGGARTLPEVGFLCTGASAPGTQAFHSSAIAADLCLRRDFRLLEAASEGKSESVPAVATNP
jgi:hypothetical protein